MPTTPTPKPETRTLNVRIPLDLFTAIEEQREEGQKRTAVVIRLLTAGLQTAADHEEDNDEVGALLGQLAELTAEMENHQAESNRLGRQFDLVTCWMASGKTADQMVPTDKEATALMNSVDTLLKRSALTAKPAPAGATAPSEGSLVIDNAEPLRVRLSQLASMMGGSGILAELGVTPNTDMVARMALSRGLTMMEGGTAAPTALAHAPQPRPVVAAQLAHAPQPVPSAPVHPQTPVPAHPQAPPRPTPGAYSRAMPVTRHQIDSKPSQLAQRAVDGRGTPMAEAHGDFDDKMADIPQGGVQAPQGVGGVYQPDPAWRPWAPDIDGGIAPEEAKLHHFYSSNGWYRWFKPQADGRLVTFYWADNPRAQGIAPFEGDSNIIVEALQTEQMGIAHAIARVA